MIKSLRVNNHKMVSRNSVKAAEAACAMNAELVWATNFPNLSQLKTVSTSTNGSSREVRRRRLGKRVHICRVCSRYVAYRLIEDGTEQSFEFTVTDQQNHILVDEDTIQPPPDDYDDHPLIDPMIEGGRGRLFPIVLVWVHPTRCSFYYQTALNVAGSGQNVFGPRATFALYKKE